MKVRGFLFWISFIGLWVGVGMGGPTLQAQPERLLLDHAQEFGRKSRPSVEFSHNRHAEIVGSCKECHHLYEKGKNVLEETRLEQGGAEIRCSSCHPSRSHLNLQRAFHDQCTGCHRRWHKEEKKAGPRYCGQCHRRR